MIASSLLGAAKQNNSILIFAPSNHSSGKNPYGLPDDSIYANVPYDLPQVTYYLKNSFSKLQALNQLRLS